MTEEEVDRVTLVLVTGFTMSDGLADTYSEKLRAKSNYEIALQTAEYMLDQHESRFAPSWAEFNKQYQRFYERWEEREAERRLALEEPQGRLAGMISPKEGRGIAAAAYAKQFRRRPPANIFALPDPEAVPKATPEEVETALAVIRGGYDHENFTFSRYTDVLKAFDGHHLTARAAVKALEDSRQVVHRPDGTLILLRVRSIPVDEPV